MNPKLSDALALMKSRFPEASHFAEERAYLFENGNEDHHFRLSIVRQGIADAGQCETIEGAFAKLIQSAEVPKTAEIENAKRILESRGFQVAKI
jgi:hypothetical protein